MRSNKYARTVGDAREAISELNSIVRDRVAAAERSIRAEMQDQFDKAHQRFAAATEKYDAEQAVLDAEAASTASGDDRIGLIYVEWVPKYRHCRELMLSGKRGVCEVFTAEMRSTSANPNRHPEPGRLIVRHLKKSGDLAKTFDVFDYFSSVDGSGKPPFGWHLEGEIPPK